MAGLTRLVIMCLEKYRAGPLRQQLAGGDGWGTPQHSAVQRGTIGECHSAFAGRPAVACRGMLKAMTRLPKASFAAQAPARAARIAGFTLVELMIVVAAIGVLAALAVQGVDRYIGSAYTAEAKSTVGAIGKAVHLAAMRRHQQNPAVKGHGLCKSSYHVPKHIARVRKRKYQPSSAPGKDYQRGDRNRGWPCLRFQVQQPQAYQYRYKRGRAPSATKLPRQKIKGGYAWTAYARGDRDGDKKYSWFVLEGVAMKGGEVRITTALAEVDPGE